VSHRALLLELHKLLLDASSAGNRAIGRGISLAAAGWEMIVVVAVRAVIFLWGPNKIPELAKSIGQARREFEKVKKDLTTFPSEENPVTPATPATPPPDDAIISTARRLGISTEGKTRDTISKENVEKAIANKTVEDAESSLK
jgi:sec-independent protein translocase protein TatA